MIRLLDGVILVVLFFMLVFNILFGLGLYDKMQNLDLQLVRVNQRISDLNRRLKWWKKNE